MMRRMLLIAAALLLAASPGICQMGEMPEDSTGQQALPPGHPPIDGGAGMGRGGQAPPMDQGAAPYGMELFTPENLREYQGRIAAMGLAISTAPGEEDQPTNALMIALEAEQEGTIQVLLGPSWYLYQLEPRLRVGDQVTVAGWLVPMDDAEMVVAKSVTKEGQTIMLRDDYGRPLWAGGRMRPGGGMMQRRGACPMMPGEEAPEEMPEGGAMPEGGMM